MTTISSAALTLMVEVEVEVEPIPKEEPFAMRTSPLPLTSMARSKVTAETGVTLFDAAEDKLEPTPLIARTVKVTGAPFARPVTTIGLVAPETC